MNEKEYLSSNPELKTLFEDLEQLTTTRKYQFVLFIQDVTGNPIMSGSITNPKLLSEFIYAFCSNTVSELQKGHLNPKSLPVTVCNLLVSAVFKHISEIGIADKYNKYNRFCEGDTSGMTEKEIDEFLDMKLHGIRSKKDFDINKQTYDENIELLIKKLGSY